MDLFTIAGPILAFALPALGQRVLWPVPIKSLAVTVTALLRNRSGSEEEDPV